MKEKKKLSLAAQIFIALVLAVVAGLLMQKYANFAETYIKPFGTIFLNLLKFIVVPIVLFSIMCGIISMKDIKKVGSIGAKTVVYYMCTTAFAITFGLIGANMFKGAFPKIATTDLSYKADQTISLMDTRYDCKYLPIKFCITDGGGKYAPGDRDGTDSWIWNYPSGGR